MKMPSTCLLTDSAAQFTLEPFRGQRHVRVLPLDIEVDGITYLNGSGLKPSQLPASMSSPKHAHVIAPQAEIVDRLLNELREEYDHIIAMPTTSSLNPTFPIMEKTLGKYLNNGTVQIIDSQLISCGLGMLIEEGAANIENGLPSSDIEFKIRQLIPRIYTIFCTPGLSYLHQAGILDHAQASVGEMLGINPIFTLEDGLLNPLDKVRNFRNVVDFFQEFLDEFDHLDRISIIQSLQPPHLDFSPLKEHISERFPLSQLQEMTFNLQVASILGPRTVGMVVMEPEEEAI